MPLERIASVLVASALALVSVRAQDRGIDTYREVVELYRTAPNVAHKERVAAMRARWQEQPWYRAAAALDRGGAARRAARGGLPVNRAVLAAAIALALAPRIQVFRSAADAVRVDVLVTEGRRPIGGLTAVDFELRDSAVAQTIDDVHVQEVPFSMMLALDTSSSMEGRPLAELQDAARTAIGALRPDDRAAAPAGWHPIEVKVKGRRATVRARRGYERGPATVQK